MHSVCAHNAHIFVQRYIKNMKMENSNEENFQENFQRNNKIPLLEGV